VTLVRIRPGPAFGRLRAPASKSYTHRALVVGHLSQRTFRVRNPLDSDDTRATAAGLTRMGSRLTRRASVWTVDSHPDRPSRSIPPVRCGESGTTLRFLVAVAALTGHRTSFEGDPGLSGRPIEELLGALRTLGAQFWHPRRGRRLVEIQGPIHGGRVSLDASRSSQFTSALLLSLPFLAEDSEIRLTGEVVSQPYVEATLAVLIHHGIRVERTRKGFRVPGRQRVSGLEFPVPGDASSAAYAWAAAAVSGGEVRVMGISAEWPQADLAVLDLLEANGAVVTRLTDGAVVRAATRRPFRIDLTDAPDLYPLAGVLAATTPGQSRILGAEHVVLKESDRRSATSRLASELGARVRATREGLAIEGTDRPRALSLRASHDHRVVMSAAVGALAGRDVSTIGDAGAVRKSFPGFWRTLHGLQEEEVGGS